MLVDYFWRRGWFFVQMWRSCGVLFVRVLFGGFFGPFWGFFARKHILTQKRAKYVMRLRRVRNT